jgi:hypothetical protein
VFEVVKVYQVKVNIKKYLILNKNKMKKLLGLSLSMALLALAISPAYGAASNSGVATGVTVAAGGDISAVYNGDFAVGGDGLNFAASGAAVAVDIAATNNADPVVALDGATDNITVTSTQGNQAWHLAIKATDFENGAETVTLTPEATDTGESAIEISTINVTNEALNDTGCV